jgi:hypothetical protein
VLADLAILRNSQGNKSHIEGWYDILKKVMRISRNSSSKKDGDNKGIKPKNYHNGILTTKES